MLSAWIGYREIGISFLGTHVSDIMKIVLFGGLFLCLTSVFLYVQPSYETPVSAEWYNHIFIIPAAILITITIMECAGAQTSAVTAMWGALFAGHISIEHDSAFPATWMLTSMIVAPVLGIVLFKLFERILQNRIYRRDIHLLTKNLYMKRLALAAILLAGVAMTINVAVFLSPYLAWGRGPLGNIATTPRVVLACILAATITATTLLVARHDTSRYKQMRHTIPSVLAQSLVMLAFTMLPPTLGLARWPIPVSPAQLRTATRITSTRDHRSIINMLFITILTPSVAILVTNALFSLEAGAIETAVITAVIIITCTLIRLYTRQARKHKQVRNALLAELSHKDETDDEHNKLNVAAVTSSFNTMSNEIDIKHKELVNLSLFIKQQRLYMEDVRDRLLKLAREKDMTVAAAQMTELAQSIGDNMKLTGEMDQFYSQVEDLHKNFVSRLQMRCPTLSEKEKRLAILLRLGFSSKDIASIMNVAAKSVEVSRYRFRRKLKIDRSVNIVQYLQMI